MGIDQEVKINLKKFCAENKVSSLDVFDISNEVSLFSFSKDGNNDIISLDNDLFTRVIPNVNLIGKQIIDVIYEDKLDETVFLKFLDDKTVLVCVYQKMSIEQGRVRQFVTNISLIYKNLENKRVLR